MAEPLSVVGLFSGVGGIEEGLRSAGYGSIMHCEIDPHAQAVLRRRYPDVKIHGDVRALKSLPRADLIAAAFPCQDLSQAGRTAGINGANSGLVDHLFRLLKTAKRTRPSWLLIENVPFMLQLDRGRAMRHVTSSLGRLGFSWAYRVVDTRAFGLPQRRRRVILLASHDHDPREVLFQGNAQPLEPELPDGSANGFYWTEGTKGLGWAGDAIPPLKGGSSIGIPSPPAIWMPDGAIVTPDIRDAERLQGFPAGWTLARSLNGNGRAERPGHRWRMIGNAVSVPVARWVGRRLRAPKKYDDGDDIALRRNDLWPTAAWGNDGKAYAADLTSWPVQYQYRHLADFLSHPVKPLSRRASEGFLQRARASSLRFPTGFLSAVAKHVERSS